MRRGPYGIGDIPKKHFAVVAVLASRRKEKVYKFALGQQVEFRSEDRSGCWKSGVVVKYGNLFPTRGRYLKLQVGPGVYVYRPEKKCRDATTNRTDSQQ